MDNGEVVDSTKVEDNGSRTEEETSEKTPPEKGPIEVTKLAAEQVLKILQEEGLPPETKLRVKVIGGGCAGFSYDLAFSETEVEGDITLTCEGVNIVVDQLSLMYLYGTQIDYVDSLIGTGFKFNNPNTSSTCGCGSSFTV